MLLLLSSAALFAALFEVLRALLFFFAFTNLKSAQQDHTIETECGECTSNDECTITDTHSVAN